MDNISLCTNDNVEEILKKYADMVYRVAFTRTKNSADSDDILQEVFMRYVRANINFDDDEHTKAWLIRATINCSINLLTSAWHKKTTNLEDNILIDMQEKSEVYYAVLELPKKYTTIIHLFYYEDMSIKQISTLLNKKESTVKSLLHRARNMLREKLKGEYDYV